MKFWQQALTRRPTPDGFVYAPGTFCGECHGFTPAPASTCCRCQAALPVIDADPAFL